jgi:hypothetical protein
MRYTDEDIRADLQRAIDEAGSLRKLSDECGLSPTFLSQVRRGDSLPGPTLAAYLGYEDDGKRWIKKA